MRYSSGLPRHAGAIARLTPPSTASAMITTSQRRQRILQLLMDQGNVQVSELSPMFAVSTVTIRNDLSFFEEQGLVTRTYGGAYLRGAVVRDRIAAPMLAARVGNLETIGARAAAMVGAGENILLDAGTAAFGMPAHLCHLQGVTAMTNGLDVAAALAGAGGIQLMCTGGLLRRPSRAFAGAQAEKALAGYRFDRLFIGAECIDGDLHLALRDEGEARLLAAMIDAAKSCVVLAHSSLLDGGALHRVEAAFCIDVLIADSGLPAAQRAACAAHDVELILVE